MALVAARQRLRLSATRASQAASQALDSLSQFSGDFGVAGGNSTAAAMTWAREGTGAKVHAVDSWR